MEPKYKVGQTVRGLKTSQHYRIHTLPKMYDPEIGNRQFYYCLRAHEPKTNKGMSIHETSIQAIPEFTFMPGDKVRNTQDGAPGTIIEQPMEIGGKYLVDIPGDLDQQWLQEYMEKRGDEITPEEDFEEGMPRPVHYPAMNTYVQVVENSHPLAGLKGRITSVPKQKEKNPFGFITATGRTEYALAECLGPAAIEEIPALAFAIDDAVIRNSPVYPKNGYTHKGEPLPLKEDDGHAKQGPYFLGDEVVGRDVNGNDMLVVITSIYQDSYEGITKIGTQRTTALQNRTSITLLPVGR